MSKSSAVRNCKKLAKRKASLKRKREHAGLRAAADLFPEIRVDPGGAPAELVKAIKAAAREVRIENAHLLPDSTREFFRIARRHGFLSAFVGLTEAYPLEAEFSHMFHVICEDLGSALFERTPVDVLERHLPYTRIAMEFGEPSGTSITVTFRSLLKAQTSGGTVYFSRHEPKLTLMGGDKIVAFTRQAIETISERTIGDRLTYNGSSHVFRILNSCVYFEDASDLLGHPGFTFYMPAEPGFWGYQYVEKILGQGDPAQTHYFRIGYCPVVVDGPFAVAKTLLLPGMHGTPEYVTLARSCLPQHEKERMKSGVDGLTWRRLVECNDFSLLRWFHDHGVPQVVALDREVFRRSLEPHPRLPGR